MLGGVAVWLNYIVQGLSKLDWNVYVGAVNGAHHRASDYLTEYPFENVVVINNPSATRYGRVTAISKAIKDTGAEIVLSVNIPDVFNAVAMCRGSGLNTKAVMTLHGLEADFFQDIRAQSPYIDAVICTNRLTRSMVVDYARFSSERTFYAPYGVSVGEPLQPKNKSNRLTLLYAGRLEQPQKRCRDLVLMAQKLEDCAIKYQLLIAGDGPDKESLIEELVAIADVGSIRYLGQLGNKEFKDEILPSADLLVLMSEWETGPIIIWEAMAAGVTVLSSRYIGSGVEQALIDGENCLMFDIGDIDQAIEQIKSLDEPGMIEKLNQAALDLVESRYSLSASIEDWNSVLLKISQDVTAKPSSSVDTGNWTIKGRIERLLGHKNAAWFRRCVRCPAYTNSPGDEWPHSYGRVDSTEQALFMKSLYSLELQPSKVDKHE